MPDDTPRFESSITSNTGRDNVVDVAVVKAFLRRVGLEEMIAKDFEEYTDIAIRVASDKEYRKQLSDKLKTTRMNLFNQQACGGGVVFVF